MRSSSPELWSCPPGLVPFAHEPPELRRLAAAGLTSHTCEHRDLTGFAGQRVVVLGAGQSALESAALLHEAGARPTVVARAATVAFGDPPQTDTPSARPRSTRLHKPGSPSARAGHCWLSAEAPPPTAICRRRCGSVCCTPCWGRPVPGGCGSAWTGRFPVLCGRMVRSAEPEDGTVRLELTDTGGGRRTAARRPSPDGHGLPGGGGPARAPGAHTSVRRCGRSAVHRGCRPASSPRCPASTSPGWPRHPASGRSCDSSAGRVSPPGRLAVAARGRNR